MCQAIYLKILQEFVNFMVSAVHLLTVMFRIFMEKQDLLRIQSKVGNIFLLFIVNLQYISVDTTVLWYIYLTSI